MIGPVLIISTVALLGIVVSWAVIPDEMHPFLQMLATLGIALILGVSFYIAIQLKEQPVDIDMIDEERNHIEVKNHTEKNE